jgi:hypothetical protein
MFASFCLGGRYGANLPANIEFRPQLPEFKFGGLSRDFRKMRRVL